MISAPARHKIISLDTFTSDDFNHLQQTENGSPIDAHLAEPEEESAPISTLHFDSDLSHKTEGPTTTSFLGLTIGDNGETTLVIPDGPYDV